MTVDTEFDASWDEVIVPELEVGGRETFEELYHRLFDRMRRLAYVLVDTEEQAAEVVQEAFARLFPRYDRVRDAESYLRTTVLNLGRKVLSRRRVARAHPGAGAQPEASPNAHDHVLDAVRRLPAAQRSVIVLRYYLQLTDEEISSTLDMRLGTVKSTLHRARQQLREVLQP